MSASTGGNDDEGDVGPIRSADNKQAAGNASTRKNAIMPTQPTQKPGVFFTNLTTWRGEDDVDQEIQTDSHSTYTFSFKINENYKQELGRMSQSSLREFLTGETSLFYLKANNVKFEKGVIKIKFDKASNRDLSGIYSSFGTAINKWAKDKPLRNSDTATDFVDIPENREAIQQLIEQEEENVPGTPKKYSKEAKVPRVRRDIVAATISVAEVQISTDKEKYLRELLELYKTENRISSYTLKAAPFSIEIAPSPKDVKSEQFAGELATLVDSIQSEILDTASEKSYTIKIGLSPKLDQQIIGGAATLYIQSKLENGTPLDTEDTTATIELKTASVPTNAENRAETIANAQEKLIGTVDKFVAVVTSSNLPLDDKPKTTFGLGGGGKNT